MNSLTLADVFIGMARRWSDRKAIISPNLKLPDADLVREPARSARELRSQGVVAETNIGICLRDNAETLVLMIAVWMLGATAVPMDFRTNAAERSLLAKEFALAAIVADRQVAAAGYLPVFLDPSWADTIAKQTGAPSGRAASGLRRLHSFR